jgi:hypothetical protein
MCRLMHSSICYPAEYIMISITRRFEKHHTAHHYIRYKPGRSSPKFILITKNSDGCKHRPDALHKTTSTYKYGGIEPVPSNLRLFSMNQSPEFQSDHWLQRQSLTLAQLFLPFKNNVKLPALLINGPDCEDPFVFIIPFENPFNRVTSIGTAVRECVV